MKKMFFFYLSLYFFSNTMQEKKLNVDRQIKKNIKKNTNSIISKKKQKITTTPIKKIISKLPTKITSHSEKIVKKELHKIKNKVNIHNFITDESITYTGHWYKPFPSEFNIFIDGREFIILQKGKTVLCDNSFTVNKNKVTIVYKWILRKFGQLWHSEKKELEFEVANNASECTLSFSWETENRITLDNAKMTKCINL